MYTNDEMVVKTLTSKLVNSMGDKTCMTFNYEDFECDLKTEDLYYDVLECLEKEYPEVFGILDTLRFDDKIETVYFLLYETIKNNKEEKATMKETVTIGQAFEKYTIDNYKEFVDKALGFPDVDFENEEAFGKFLNENRVQIISQGKLMELPYDADVINEIEFALKEINEVYNGTAECTAGNTVSSMYRNASYKDILVANMLRIMDSGKSYKDSIRYTINNFGETAFRETMKYIENNAKTLSEEYGVNYHQLNTMSLAVLFNTDTRRNTIIDLLCQKVEILEGKDNDDYHSDIVFLMDFSIKRSGDLIAWHYGADFNINSKTNQEYIRKYIADLTN